MNKYLILPILILTLSACSKAPQDDGAETVPPKQASTEPTSIKEKTTIDEPQGILIPRSVSGDKGQYYLLDKKKSGAIVETLHKRIGVDSIGYTRMKINCETAQVQEIGYSETSADDIVSNPTNWYDLVANSSKYDLYTFVCK
jgi:hypothetical protein